MLHVTNAWLQARTQAWPMPAHKALNLSLDAEAQPRSVELPDAVGRVVLTQPQPAAGTRCPCAVFGPACTCCASTTPMAPSRAASW
ncbi:hypothetical protein [Hymenobacter lucidus]|uniref:Uncharacterized protein n=1 Tax=Hymenobacter lucidus TaxID=2880930 RepID=A0ABS8ASY3_9BACT|nr:hypothetical protein [Hymenobacter lucidus]MCB2409310.1 hypothetical protein [Hymenobacter lucidus]